MRWLNSKIYFKVFLLFIFSLLFEGCTKFVQIPPPTNQLVSANVFTSDGSATSAVTGIYANMFQGNFASGGQGSVTLLSGLSADEFTNSSTYSDFISFADNSLTLTNNSVLGLWNSYQYIYAANAIMEGLNGAGGVSDSVKKQLAGEAKFVRAFTYFYLTNLFGDVPLYLTTNYQVNQTSSRTPSAQVYDQIVSDLKDAQNSLASDYSYSKGERIRPNKWAATALLGRVYLYEKKYDSAELESTAVINNTDLFSLDTDLNAVFLANSSEAIWQLLPVSPNINTQEGQMFILTAPPTMVSLSPFVTGAFEPGDQRQVNWVGTFTDGTNTWYFPYKYKVQASPVLTEYSMVLRLAEQYLIRAESRANQNNISGAQADLNAIRGRAGLGSTPANDLSSMTSALEHERQVELFSEWGHRWLDLSRTNRANAVLGTEKLGWEPTDILYPIPATELQNNSRITQNAGY